MNVESNEKAVNAFRSNNEFTNQYIKKALQLINFRAS